MNDGENTRVMKGLVADAGDWYMDFHVRDDMKKYYDDMEKVYGNIEIYIRKMVEKKRSEVKKQKGEPSYEFRYLELDWLCGIFGIDTDELIKNKELLNKIPSEEEQKRKLADQLYRLYKNAYRPAQYMQRLTNALADEELKSDTLRLTILKQFVKHTSMDREYFEKELLTEKERKADEKAKNKMILSRLKDGIFPDNAACGSDKDKNKRLMDRLIGITEKKKELSGLTFSDADCRKIAEDAENIIREVKKGKRSKQNTRIISECKSVTEAAEKENGVGVLLKKISECTELLGSSFSDNLAADIKAAVRRAGQKIALEGGKKVSWYEYIHTETKGRSPLESLMYTVETVSSLEKVCGVKFELNDNAVRMIPNEVEKYSRNMSEKLRADLKKEVQEYLDGCISDIFGAEAKEEFHKSVVVRRSGSIVNHAYDFISNGDMSAQGGEKVRLIDKSLADAIKKQIKLRLDKKRKAAEPEEMLEQLMHGKEHEITEVARMIDRLNGRKERESAELEPLLEKCDERLAVTIADFLSAHRELTVPFEELQRLKAAVGCTAEKSESADIKENAGDDAENDSSGDTEENGTGIDGIELIRLYAGTLKGIYERINGEAAAECGYIDGTEEFRMAVKQFKDSCATAAAQAVFFNTCRKFIAVVNETLKNKKYRISSRTGKDYINEQLRENPKTGCGLLRLCDDLANGIFDSRGQSADNIFRYAAVFGMKYYTSREEAEKEKNPYLDIEKNLFWDYYSYSIVGWLSGKNAELYGERINFKNFMQTIYVYCICSKEYGTPDEKLRAADRIAEKCIARHRGLVNGEEVNTKVGCGIYSFGDVTRKYRDNFVKYVMQLSESEFVDYLAQNYTVPGKLRSDVGDNSAAADGGGENIPRMMYANDTAAAGKVYADILGRLKKAMLNDGNKSLRRKGKNTLGDKATDLAKFITDDEELYELIMNTYSGKDCGFADAVEQMRKKLDIFTNGEFADSSIVTRTKLITLYSAYFKLCAQEQGEFTERYYSFSDVFNDFREKTDELLEAAGFQGIREKNLFDMYTVYSVCMKVFDCC